MSRIGFIGLGNMGSLMAANLLKKGRKVVVFDVVESAAFKLKAAGAEIAKSPKEVARRAEEAVLTMLPGADNVREVYTGENGLLMSPKPDSLFIDCSTIDPRFPGDLACRSYGAKVQFADAPVSGGTIAARDGTLTFMVGCDENQFDRVKAVLKLMGNTVHYCGTWGTGQATKMCNNMLAAISMIGVSEAMNLGQRMRLDPKKLAAVINTSSGRCWSSEVYNPVPGVVANVPASNDYNDGFRCQLMAKDLNIAVNAAMATNSSIPLGSLAAQIYQLLCQQGYANRDFSAIYKFLCANEQPTKK